MDNQNNLSLEGFVDKLISEKKEFEGLDEEVMAQIKADLLEQAEDRIKAVLVSNMPEDKMEEFASLTESGSDQEVQAFCQQNIPDLAQLIATELLLFRKTYIS